MKILTWFGFAMWLSSCSLLTEDVDVSLDCEADPFGTDCLDGQRLGCNSSKRVVAETCPDTQTCKRITIGAEQKGICAPDCEGGSVSRVCEGNLLLECRGNSIETTDCGSLTCTEMTGCQ